MPENLSTLLRATAPMVLTAGWGRTEGPLWHAEGYVTLYLRPGGSLATLEVTTPGIGARSA